MPSDSVCDFLVAGPMARLRALKSGNEPPGLEDLLGRNALSEYRALASELDESHLGVEHPKNLVFVPGVMGSLLMSKTKGGIWWIDVRTRHHIEDLALSHDGTSDASSDHAIVPVTTDPSYEAFLVAVLKSRFGHEVFPYDWRKPLGQSAAALRDLIHRLHAQNGGAPVHLVGHSMGGLMIRTTLMLFGEDLWPKVGRIVFIGTPNFGSPAIAGYLKNHLWGFELLAILGLYLGRATFRSLRGVLSMLPAPPGIYPGTRDGDDHPCANFDLYDARDWGLDLEPVELELLQNSLDAAAANHRALSGAHDRLHQEFKERMAVIAGVGFKTLFRIEYERRFFGLWNHAAKITDRDPGDPHREGDGRVPVASARLSDVATYYARAVHGGMPNVPAIYRGVFQLLAGERPDLAASLDEALSGHLGSGDSSATPALDGTHRTRADDDAGIWTEAEPPDPDRTEALLAEGKVPDFFWARIL
jgi:pimeloyl-ACP methyl ester carboxylesterase